MMWLVRLALRRPLSVAVMALLMLVLGALSFTLMNVDIFPAINLPVVMVVWSYPGLNAVDMERRMVIISERAYSTTVDGIEHIESESITGIGHAESLFSAGHGYRRAQSRRSMRCRRLSCARRRTGTTPPQIISYNAANVPVAQLNIFSETLSEQQLFDYGLNFIRAAALHDSGIFVTCAARRRAARGRRQSRSRGRCTPTAFRQWISATRSRPPTSSSRRARPAWAITSTTSISI